MRQPRDVSTAEDPRATEHNARGQAPYAGREMSKLSGSLAAEENPQTVRIQAKKKKDSSRFRWLCLHASHAACN